MPVVTGMRAAGADRVAVELDGAPWRTLPIAVVARTGLVEGQELERADLRVLRRELRCTEAVARAARFIERRAASEHRVRESLARAGFAPGERAQALSTLRRAGYLDDERLACRRAETLASRGLGDEAIRADLERAGIGAALVEAALAELASEHERAAAVVARHGRSATTVRRLARKGFSADTLESLFPENCA